MDITGTIAKLEVLVAQFAPLRQSDPLANDMYEAADDWAGLGRLLLENSGHNDFQGRGRQENELHGQLNALLPLRERARCQPVLDLGWLLIQEALQRYPAEDGYLGIARVARSAFSYLIKRGFIMSAPAPAKVWFCSERIGAGLTVEDDREASFAFGPVAGAGNRYSLADLLYLHGDPRWQEMTGSVHLATAAEVQDWFGFVVTTFSEHGQEVMDGLPDVFERLDRAQTERDEAYGREMDAEFSELRSVDGSGR